MADVTQDQVVEYIKNISVMELSKLVKTLEAELGGLPQDLARELLRLVELLDVGGNFLLRELPRRVADRSLFGRQCKIQGGPPAADAIATPEIGPRISSRGCPPRSPGGGDGRPSLHARAS